MARHLLCAAAMSIQRPLLLVMFLGFGLFDPSTGGAAAQSAPPGHAVVWGRVVDADDRSPVADALTVLRRGTVAGSPVIDRVRTDQQGRFVFAALASGTWSVAAGKEGYESSG